VCTLTWLREGEGYELFFNRDELSTRLPARAPERRTSRGVEFLAPIDADAGGTWLAVNAFGVAVGIMNGELRSVPPAESTSRGLLVLALADSGSVGEIARRLGETELSPLRGFSLFALEPEEKLLLARWDGLALALAREDDSVQPLSSSSRDPRGAELARKALFAQLFARERPTRALLEAFHASHEPGRGALSPCMHRDDAATVSFTRVKVDRRAVELGSSSGPPCRGGRLATLRLPRKLLARAARAAHGEQVPGSRPGAARGSDPP